MRIIDVDAHVHEPVDWLQQADPDLAATLGPPLRFIDMADNLFGVKNPAMARLPERQQPDSPWHSLPPGFGEHLEMTDQRQPQSREKGDPFCDAAARVAHCDAAGIDVQFLNPSFLVTPFAQAARVKRRDLITPIKQAWNSWTMRLVEGYESRLIPVTQIDLNDVDGAVAEMTRMRNLGSRAFSVSEAPVGVGGARTGGGKSLARSITHPDFEPIWSAAEDLEMAAIAHVGFARERIQFGWANNGADDISTYSMLAMAVAPSLPPQLLLGALAFDGVLERHPKLTVIVEEVGISWVPHLLAVLDNAIGKSPIAAHDNEYRPHFSGTAYRFPLTPSEYLSRQVRVTPLVATEPLYPTLEIAPEMICFSSDYPHVEGATDAVGICDKQLKGRDESLVKNFYGGVAELMGI